MGIKQYFITTSRRFPHAINTIPSGQKLSEATKKKVDSILIDSNGIIHTAAQKTFKYGNYKPENQTGSKYNRLMPKRSKDDRTEPNNHVVHYTQEARIQLFQIVTEEIERLIHVIEPKKQIVICIDGSAPLTKQNQQRQRRYRAAQERTDCKFDSNAITPGTLFLDQLSSYLHRWIVERVKSNWSHLEIIFSNEKVPGEGEAKILHYVRKYGNQKYSYCIVGADADLIMLSLASHIDKFYVLRENMSYNAEEGELLLVDIPTLRNELIKAMRWDQDGKVHKHTCNSKSIINDYVFMCFMCGNDFVPHMPSIEIIEGGIDFFIHIYREIGPMFGHLTATSSSNGVLFRPTVLREFLVCVANQEKINFEKKLNNGSSYFMDEIMDHHISQNPNSGKFEIDVESYRCEYAEKMFPDSTPTEVCHQYLEGLQWVLWYYTSGVPHWRWLYPHHYAPMASSLIEYINTFVTPKYPPSKPIPPLLQLVYVLPPRSARLLPKFLGDLLHSPEFEPFCPKRVEIDFSGKRREWEGIVLTPIINQEVATLGYESIIHSGKVHPKDMSRNKNGITFSYKKSSTETESLNPVKIEFIDLYNNKK